MDSDKAQLAVGENLSHGDPLTESESPTQFERIAATSPDIIFIYDQAQGRNTYCNGRVLDVLGYSSEQFQSKNFHF